MTAGPPRSRTAALVLAIRGMSPAYFGMVMATGIIAIAVRRAGMSRLATGLFALAVAAYVVLWGFTLVRVARFFDEVKKDLLDHRRGMGFFTTVAGTCVLGSDFVLIAGEYRVGLAFWFIGVVLWAGLTYAIFTILTIKEYKPPLEEGITGAWLLAIVATQSVAVLSGLLATHLHQPARLQMNFLALILWLWGGMLYIWMISLIFYRYTFFKFSPGDLAPPYWINMGAMAISTLAGSILILGATEEAPFLHSLLPFLKGFTAFYWVTGTWWIPMLFILAVWRHVYKRFPLAYDPLYWGAVFPLGMYTASTYKMAEALAIDFLVVIPTYFVYFALAVWVAVFYGMVRGIVRVLWAGVPAGEAVAK